MHNKHVSFIGNQKNLKLMSNKCKRGTNLPRTEFDFNQAKLWYTMRNLKYTFRSMHIHIQQSNAASYTQLYSYFAELEELKRLLLKT